MIPQIDKQSEDKKIRQEKQTKGKRDRHQDDNTRKADTQTHTTKPQRKMATDRPRQTDGKNTKHYPNRQNQTATPKQTGKKENRHSKYFNWPCKTQPDIEKQPGKQAEIQHIQKPMLAHSRANQRRDKTASRNKSQGRRKENGRQNPVAFI